jgi:RNA polymerase sigma factor (sigma-70 family)
MRLPFHPLGARSGLCSDKLRRYQTCHRDSFVPMPPLQDTEQTRWFSMEVQPHEAALRAYLQARFPMLRDADDIVQETYTRLLREKDAGRVRHTRALMFTVARNAALDFFRRRRTVQMDAITHLEAANVVEEAPHTAEVISQQQELAVLAEAVQTLPHRCRQVIMLRYLKGHSYKEIAVTLGISGETVKTHMAKGVKLCADYFAARGLLQERTMFSDDAR